MRLLIAPSLVILAACSSSSSATVAGAPDAAGVQAPSLCANEPRAQVYQKGIQQLGSGGHFSVKLLDISPSPVAQGTNRWNIALSDATGAAPSGATLSLTPRLPDHGLSAADVPLVATDPLKGQFTISRIDLAMPGVWTFTFDVTAGAVSDQVTFTFCIDE